MENKENCRKRHKRLADLLAMVGAYIAVTLAGVVIAEIPTVITAAIILPIAYRERGYEAVGGEWLLIIFVFCVAYSVTHRIICDRIFGEEE